MTKYSDSASASDKSGLTHGSESDITGGHNVTTVKEKDSDADIKAIMASPNNKADTSMDCSNTNSSLDTMIKDHCAGGLMVSSDVAGNMTVKTLDMLGTLDKDYKATPATTMDGPENVSMEHLKVMT